MREADCIFCKIARQEIPTPLVYENESAAAFLDIAPLAEGHLLVIPRSHYTHLADMPANVCSAIGALLPRLGQALMSVTEAEGFNVLQNNGRAAGQAVEHVHFHLIPRKAGDNLGYRWNAGQYAPGRDAKLLSAYKNALV